MFYVEESKILFVNPPQPFVVLRGSSDGKGWLDPDTRLFFESRQEAQRFCDDANSNEMVEDLL